jgi:hypothetical protein
MSYTIRQYPASPSNQTAGRNGNRVSEIIIHHAASTSFDSIGQTFSNPARQASAHYGVGRNNNVDQYVKEDNGAWHCGNFGHNMKSIGIEHVNSSGAPDWNVAEETFRTSVELCRDIATRHGLLPLRVGVNLFQHKEVSDRPTACAMKMGDRLQELANKVNNTAAGQSPTAPRKSVATVAAEVRAGAWGNGDDRKARLAAAGYSFAEVQAEVNRQLGGGGSAAPAPARPSVAEIASQVLAGAWGNNPERQQRLQAAGFDYGAVQAEVNRQLGIGGASAPARKSEEQVANEIIAGQGGWGNNPQRAQKLAENGYNAASVQAIVNRKLGF